MTEIDLLDRKILSTLDRDGRIPVAEIAKKLEVSRQLVNIRLKKLEARDIIFGTLTIFDSGVLGYNWYRVLFRLLNISKKQKEEFINYLKEHKNVVWLGEVGGRWDIAVNFACESPVAFNTISEELSVKFGEFVKEMETLVYVDIYDYSRSYLDPDNSSRKEFFHRMSENKSIKLDSIDKKIIKNISTNGRIDNTQLGKMLGVSRNTIKKRIENLIKQKVILGFRTFLKLHNIGYQSNMLFLQVNKLDRERETELYYYLQMLPQVTFVVKHIGKWKVGLEVETKNAEEFQDLLLALRSNFSDIITDYDTFPLLKDHIINYFPDGVL
ncbi:AsnC family transcriptional regulator [Candidatus Woesearchaeota archaeon]|nr:AsnC family transcriptional regulator [Candidatus Woesearchaeota archaeon]